nr:unnamed protein product [Spirometra erinaceieuropaei]
MADARLLEELEKFATRPDILIMGNFNAPHIDRSSTHANSSEQTFDRSFLNTALKLFLTQHVMLPTRVREGQKANCLDLVLTKSQDSNDEVSCLPPLDTPIKETVQFTEGMVLTELLRLKESKSPGSDEIPAKILKELAGELSKPLSIIFHTSFETGYLSPAAVQGRKSGLCEQLQTCQPHLHLLRARMRGKLLMWIRSFLTGRSQAIHVSDQQSAEVAVWSAVPQGSVLGTTLFLVYVHDCANELNFDAAMFADDIKMWSTIRSEVDEARLQTNLDHLEQWSKDWLLPFNVNKCNCLRVGRTSFPNHTVYRLTGKPLQEVDAQKDLGVWISTSLKPSLQCSRVAKSVMSILYLVKRAFSSFDEDCFAKVFQTFLRPHPEFAIQA